MKKNLKFKSYSMVSGKKHDSDWYDWCVFVDEPADVIEKIRSVEYTLHQTFPNPVRTVEEKSIRFALFSSGWGGFTIHIEVTWEDGSSSRGQHELVLAVDDWPRKPAPKSFPDAKSEKVYRGLFHEKYRWRKAEVVGRNAGIPLAEVEKILYELQKEDLVRKAGFLSFEQKELWAPTEVVGVSPHL